MGVTLLVLGLLMNVAGVVLSSSRDLAGLWRTVGASTLAKWHAARGWLRREWAALTGKKVGTQVRPVSGSSANISDGSSCSVFAWEPAPDGMDLETAIRRFRNRTDNLNEMISFEGKQRSEGDARLHSRVEKVDKRLTRSVETLEERVDDFDVKPAGQRAVGALLVVGGTILMFTGGLIG